MRISLFVFSVFMMLVIPACNLPSVSSDPSINDQAATIVAMTLQAGSTPTAQTILNTPTAMSIVTKPGPSSFTATENTNCRSGPGKNYARITTIPGGTTVTIVARYTSGSFWIVTPPDGSGNCWVDSTLGTVTGDTTTLPQVTPVASENKDSPERPGSLYYEYSCPFGNLSTVLTWADKADNETGYRVYRNDQQIVELPANSKTYTDNTTIIVGTGISYSVEAFNEAGASEQRTISFKCQ